MAALGLTLQTVGMTIKLTAGNTDGKFRAGNTNMTSTSNTMLLIEKHY
jgi:hypothetical protein